MSRSVSGIGGEPPLSGRTEDTNAAPSIISRQCLGSIVVQGPAVRTGGGDHVQSSDSAGWNDMPRCRNRDESWVGPCSHRVSWQPSRARGLSQEDVSQLLPLPQLATLPPLARNSSSAAAVFRDGHFAISCDLRPPRPAYRH